MGDHPRCICHKPCTQQTGKQQIAGIEVTVNEIDIKRCRADTIDGRANAKIPFQKVQE
jgi:hypothetical protein